MPCKAGAVKGNGRISGLIKFYISQGLRKDRRDIWLQEAPERIQGILEKHGLTGEAQEELTKELLGIAPLERPGETKETENLHAAPL